MSLGEHLRSRRERFGLTQEWVANAVDIPRELLSYWETGARTPSAEHLKNLARVYRTTPQQLVDEHDHDETEPLHFFENVVERDQMADALRSWTDFLDRWAGFLRDDLGKTLPGPGTPPAALAEPNMVVDRRRITVLADKVRKQWDLGRFALPELYELLDRKGVLLVRMDLSELGSGSGGVFGGFFNHAELGFTGIVNSGVTPARQMLTLGHGISHALFHYSKVGILCFMTSEMPEERFGEKFGQEFLVPGKELRRQVADIYKSSGRETLEPVHGVALANLFRVSFPLMALRLVSEDLIGEEMYRSWRKVDGRDLAQRWGMELPGFPERRERVGPLRRYPPSVLTTVRWAIADGEVSVDRAAEVLGVEPEHIEGVLLAPAPQAKDHERVEHDEFEQVYRVRG